MSEQLIVKAESLEPLFGAWEEPSAHRAQPKRGKGAEVRPGRRPTLVNDGLVERIRRAVKEWRLAGYAGTSDTSGYLLAHWFGRAHTNDGGQEFRYYFCQREAMETLIYLYEVRSLRCLSQIVAEFGGPQAETLALGIEEGEDNWARYAFKMATGSGKTKVMSLAMVWSYFHALRESESALARHFVVVAPNLTVFERLKEDFRPEGGGPDIFDKDPLIPVEWRSDWNLSVVLQDEASGATTGGALYLTNIHRLYEPAKRKKSSGDMADFMGPAVSRAQALDTGAALRERITGHGKVMILNDEAHHVWDPDSAWNEAILSLHETLRKKSGGGLTAQLDFSATPKDNKANYFKHIICDTPLGEAVDAGIIKTPIIGRAGQLHIQATNNAGYKYEMHLKLGYERWLKSKEEWEKSGKKALIFVMCEDTQAADEIAARLNGDPLFEHLNGKTINLHTNLKGKLKARGKAVEFVENEKEISDEDLKALRKLSRELDSGSSPYSCIVSVLMLREGWDVRNVTTIVPLRAYSQQGPNILAEQTLGRGLRRMTPPGQANEVVAVVEHDSFAALYGKELAEQGAFLETIDVRQIPTTTVSIFPDPKKDLEKLKIELPRLTAGHESLATLAPIGAEEIKKSFDRFEPLQLGRIGSDEVQYEGKHLITGEVVEHMKVYLTLLATGVGAISYYVQELEYLGKVKGTHGVLAPLLQKFFEEILFESKATIYDQSLVKRLSDSDVKEHVRGVFLPLIRARTVREQKRMPEAAPMQVAQWRPYQVTVSERRPVKQAERTLFNLVQCNGSLEQAFVEFAERAPDVAAFAKNAGPQALRIDYLAAGGRLAFYIPDFLVRLSSGHYLLVEVKGRVDRDVAAKARAAIAWCKSASTGAVRWDYLYVPENVFQQFRGTQAKDLDVTCRPSLKDLLAEEQDREQMPLFAGVELAEKPPLHAAGLVDEKMLAGLPARMRKAADEAITLYRFFENKTMSYSPLFQPLLGVVDDAARGVLVKKLGPLVPHGPVKEKDWFEPLLDKVDNRMQGHYRDVARNLKKTLVLQNGVSPLGLLRNCLDHALNDRNKIAGVFATIRDNMRFDGGRKLLDLVQKMNEFRNTRVAHEDKPLTDQKEAKAALVTWIEGLAKLWDLNK